MRDWGIALRPLTDLPLVGPPTHVRGYTIGPAFYWILWAIRVTLGPWFDNLPHAGGIGQALLQSAADTLLLAAVWSHTKSVWVGLTTAVLVATASFDLALSATVWNPVMGSTLAKVATALVLLDWHRRSVARVVVTAAAAWSAVHAYTGAIFVAIGVFAALLLDPLVRGERARVWRNLLASGLVVVVLQLPYLAHQIGTGFRDPAMGAVTGSLARVLAGDAAPQLRTSLVYYGAAFDNLQVAPATWRLGSWLLPLCALIVIIRYRRDVPVLTMAILPQSVAIVGYSLFLSGLDAYYYMSLMPAAVLTVVLAAASVPSAQWAQRVAVVMLVGALALLPMRLRHAATLFRMPEYKALVEGSRKIVGARQPMRAIRTDLALPPTGDPQYLYLILGGRLDRQSPWVAVIMRDGTVRYQRFESAATPPSTP